MSIKKCAKCKRKFTGMEITLITITIPFFLLGLSTTEWLMSLFILLGGIPTLLLIIYIRNNLDKFKEKEYE